MKDKIRKYLSELEKDKGIEILLACETGSRAWGFPSPDSDFDVRIIYKHEKDWYLSLAEKKDTIDIFLDNNEIDISGWDLRKSLRLLWKSNPPLLERIQSPIIYKSDQEFVVGITAIAQKTY
ncbi:MAG: nucleotidyltransferase domain-containing protein, partial [Bacteroidetes bacterium]